MKFQLWRNATIQLKINNSTFLIDPMLGKKGSFGQFPWTNDKRENPLVDLPFSESEIRDKISIINAVLVSHLHPDHWDQTAIELIDKKSTVICPKVIAKQLASYGFQNILVLSKQLHFDDIALHLTNGQHGTGQIGEKMGQVNGFVFEHQGNSVYVTGDTIWCHDVKRAIDTHLPKHIIVAGGAASFTIGEPVTMTYQDIKRVAEHAPNSTIWITHLESVSPCKEDREFLKDFIQSNSLEEQCKVLDDGEEVELNF